MAVLGMGGLFFRVKDPDALRAWYKAHLKVGGGCNAAGTGEANEWVWQTQGGPMVFEPFAESSDYFPTDKRHMINLRVSDLDGMAEQLRASGIEVITKPEWDMPGVGRFVRIHDPEGNPIELWEPATTG